MVGFSREAEATGSVYRGYWILETQVRELVSLGLQRGVFMEQTFWRMNPGVYPSWALPGARGAMAFVYGQGRKGKEWGFPLHCLWALSGSF